MSSNSSPARSAPLGARSRELAGATLVVAAAVAIGKMAAPWVSVANTGMLLLVAVVAVAVRAHRATALYAAVLSFLAFNFFFTEPQYRFEIQRREDAITVFAFLLTALLASQLAARLREQMVDTAERARLAAELARARLESETERLRGALLASVSHDLRTPLAAMIGAATSLSAFEAQLGREDRAALLETILAESQRLDRYIQNLLDMTRLGHGTLTLHRDWIGADEIVGATVERARRCFPSVRVDVRAEPSLPLLYVHPALIEQALFNVVENAAKFSQPGGTIDIALSREAETVHIDVIDRGPGIPESERERIFDRFYSVARGDRGGEGTGLGLAICQGMLGAHGGRIDALDGPEGVGTRMRLTLPLIDQPPAERSDS